MHLRRFTFISLLILCVIFAGCTKQVNLVEKSQLPVTEEEIIAKAKTIHEKAITLDTHVDIAGARYATPELDPGIDNPDLKVDLVKMNKGGMDGVFLAVYVGQGVRDAEGYKRAYETAIAKFDAIHRLTETMYPGRCELALTPDDVIRISKTGKRVIMIGIENGFPIGEDISNVEKFYNLGTRYITLSHNGHNQICDSCNPNSRFGDDGPEHHGLSPFGEKVVAEMNRLGIMADVAHISPESYYDLIEVSKAPIIASHSGCRALSDNSRNLDDDQLRALAKNGGVIQIVALGSFLKAASPERREAMAALAAKLGVPMRRGRPNRREMTEQQSAAFDEGMKEIESKFPSVNVKDYVDHIDHARKIAGLDHVGIGTDFDGGGGITGFNDHSEALNVTIELVRRGYSEEAIYKIWGGNLLRVWRDVNKVAASLK